jgi:hypothetical protein
MTPSKPLRIMFPVVVSVVTFVVLVLILRQAGLFSKSNAVASASLAGAFLTAMVALVGTLIKQGSDERAETRLQLEAGISALELFADPQGDPSLAIQRTGALIILSSLGHHRLTLSLGAALLPSGELEPAPAARLIGGALETGDESIRRYAVNLFVGQAPQFLTPTGYEAPEPILDGCKDYSSYVRTWSAIGMVRLLTSRDLASWKLDHRFSLNAAIVALVLLWKYESKWRRTRRRDLAGIVKAVLALVPELNTKLAHHRTTVDLAKVRKKTLSAVATGSLAIAAVDALAALGNGEATGMAKLFGSLSSPT